MATSASRHRDSSLLDRDAEVPRLGAAVNAARGGSGQCVFVTGEAGIGKTELLRVAQRLAAKAGMRVRGARGGPVEREFPFGVVRQLFDGLLARMPVQARRRLFVGAAAGAAAVVAGDAAAVGSTGLDLAQALHALYWLCSNLADDRPLVLAVDDAHWSDPESVRWLSYMAHRVDELPVLLVVATRTGDEPVDRASLEAIEVGASQVLRPGALSEAA